MPRARPGQIKLADIARRAGVSAMTVSRVLSGRDELVRPDTARRVRKAAVSLGYLARTAPRAARPAIPVIAVYAESISRKQYLAELVDVATRAIEERKHGAAVCHTAAALSLALQQFNPVAALVLAPSDGWLTGDAHLPSSARPAAVPTVVVHSPAEQATHHEVSPDVEAMACQAADHLLRLGHVELAYLGGPPPEVEPNWFELRRRGLTRALFEHGLRHAPLDQQPCLEAPLADAAVQQLLRRRPKVSGLLCDSDEIAVAAIAAARRMRLRVPEDLSVVGCGDVKWARCVVPSLSTIAIDTRTLVDTALGMLFDLLRRQIAPSGAPLKIRLPTQLVPRDSSGPCRNR
ncbi:MAG: LacI family DNA-binding transcriptional regulator [Phycisphaerae bacterium]